MARSGMRWGDSPALGLLNVVDFLARFRGMGGKIDASSVEPGVW